MINNDLLPIIDSHSHIQFPVYDPDCDAVIRRAMEARVKMIAVGTQFSTSTAGIRLAHENPENIWASVGYHPNHLGDEWHHDKNEQLNFEREIFDPDKFADLAADPKVVAIGECGFDYFRLGESEEGKAKSLQAEVFIQQAQLAQKLDKALMIHCRPSKGTDDAYEDLLSMIPNSLFTIPRIVHFYVGSPEITRKLVTEGYYFTLGGVITFSRDYDESIRLIPVDHILLETDCPYVAPKSQRGKRNEPAFIRETAAAVAKIKNMDIEEFLRIIYENSRRVFKI